MTDHETSLPNEGTVVPSITVLSANAPDQRNGDWNEAIPAESSDSLSDMMVYVHALRRHWVLSLSVGVLIAAILGPAVWVFTGEKYTSDCLLRISMQDPTILSEREQQPMDRERFEILKNTQQQYVLSRYVLTTALKKPEVANLAIIRNQNKGDLVAWLTKKLSVSFPGRAEIMQVAVTVPEAKDATTLVSAIVDAYLEKAVDAQHAEKQRRYTQLERAYAEGENFLRDKRKDLKTLADQMGASDTEALTLKQKLALDELALYRNEMTRAEFSLRAAQGELAGQQAMLDRVDKTPVNEAEINELIQQDPVARQLFAELGMQSMQKALTEKVVVAKSGSPYANSYDGGMQALQSQFDERKAKLEGVVRQKKRSLIENEVAKLSNSVAVLKSQLDKYTGDVDGLRKNAEKYGSSSVDMEMLRTDIKTRESLLAGISTQLEQLKVELRSTPRVTRFQEAEVPDSPSNTRPRIMFTLFSMFVGLCFPAIAIGLWDLQSRRVNSSDDVSKKLRLSVLGSVPLIPSRIVRRLGSPSKQSQAWNVRMTESVDGIVARVLRKAEIEQCRVIMVSSAAAGEGKTTLATQLAFSLARTGRSTVLVDFDLRRPSFDEVFGVPLEPGVAEFLRNPSILSGLAHPTATANLAVVTAGRLDRQALASLSNGAAAAMFKGLRGEYEFVVIDTSPILPVADARFVSQHVDSVVLSVFRDVSEVPKIQAACEILTAFGVRTIEAVVTGSNDHSYGDHVGYESSVPA